MTEQTSRRTLIQSLAIGGAALPVLVACGTGSTGTTGDAGSSSTPGSTATTDGGGSGAIAKTTDIPVGGGKIFGDQKVVITQPTAGDFKAFSAVCTHQSCIVAKVDGDEIDCTCHGSKFSAKDGSVINGPASSPLKEVGVTVTGEEITLA